MVEMEVRENEMRGVNCRIVEEREREREEKEKENKLEIGRAHV